MGLAVNAAVKIRQWRRGLPSVRLQAAASDMPGLPAKRDACVQGRPHGRAAAAAERTARVASAVTGQQLRVRLHVGGPERHAAGSPSRQQVARCKCWGVHCAVALVVHGQTALSYRHTIQVPHRAGLRKRPTACKLCPCRCGCSCCTSSGASEQSSDGASDTASLNNAADAVGAVLVKAGADMLSPIKGAVLHLSDSMVTLECVDAVALFDKAEEITDGKVRLAALAAWNLRHFQPSLASWRARSVPCQLTFAATLSSGGCRGCRQPPHRRAACGDPRTGEGRSARRCCPHLQGAGPHRSR